MTLTVYTDMAQRSPEWFEARCGIVTASVVGKLVTTRTLGALDYDCPDCGSTVGQSCISKVKRGGEEGVAIKTPHSARSLVAVERRGSSPLIVEMADGDDAKALTLTLLSERLRGRAEDPYVSRDMERGMLAEPFARDLYSKHVAPVAECGFMVREEGRWTLGYSPDGLIGDDGLIEIKAPRAKGHVQTVLDDEVPAQYMAQCQAALLVSGRAWLDYVSYCGGLHLWTKRVYPDPAWQSAITEALTLFEWQATALAEAYYHSAAHLPVAEDIDFFEDVI